MRGDTALLIINVHTLVGKINEHLLKYAFTIYSLRDYSFHLFVIWAFLSLNETLRSMATVRVILFVISGAVPCTTEAQ